MQKKASKK